MPDKAERSKDIKADDLANDSNLQFSNFQFPCQLPTLDDHPNTCCKQIDPNSLLFYPTRDFSLTLQSLSAIHLRMTGNPYALYP